MDRADQWKWIKSLVRHYRRLDPLNYLRGFAYERCAELPWILQWVDEKRADQLQVLDVGSGESPTPTYLLAKTNWTVTCLDSDASIATQTRYAEQSLGQDALSRLRILEEDVRKLREGPFDLILCISTIEHVSGDGDSSAMHALASALRPGGQILLTVPVNDGHPQEFFVRRDVYGKQYRAEPVFYQRHYDVQGLLDRLVAPSGLTLCSCVFFGEYGFPAFEVLFARVPRLVRLPYQWASHHIAARFVSYREEPVSRRRMTCNTASGAILVLEKPPAAEPAGSQSTSLRTGGQGCAAS